MEKSIEKRCLEKGVKLTEQRKVIARVISESKQTYGESDHPMLTNFILEFQKLIQNKYCNCLRTVKLFEEASILTKHDFKGGKLVMKK